MPLIAPVYRLLLDDPENPEAPPREVTVAVRNGDQLRAELEGSKLGLAGRGMSAAPLNYTTLWLWAAMVRTGEFTGNVQQFRASLVVFEPVKADGETLTDPEDVPAVDPTAEGHGTALP